MATTAKLRGGNFSDSGEEDIAAIAKQISDHAEAIYQTWKSRGLAPTEILNCHSNAQAADKFGSALTPQPPAASQHHPVVELQHLDNNNLEKLVNSFVVEDKARMAAARQKSPSKALPSSIQFALQKFESNSPPQPQSQLPYPAVSKQTPTSKPKPQILQKPQISPKPIFLSDTIETIFPPELTPQKPQTPKRPAYLVQQECTSSGLQTWPLKNKTINESPKRNSRLADPQIPSTPTPTPPPVSPSGEEAKFATLPSKNSPSYMDEVAREEERLINALKTGVIIAEDHTVPERTLRKTKSPKKDSVSPTRDFLPAAVEKPLSKDDRDDLSNMSIVDYAKVRYRAAQRLEDAAVKPLERVEAPAVAIVSRVRNKFEPAAAELLKGGGGVTAAGEGATPPDAAGARWAGLRPRRMDQVPHPELTSSQRQHIRAAAADKNTFGPGNNPVRPFLTRGSVAERVLIFEKCPSELLLDKRARAPAINTWRNGHEVHHKAQTFGRKEPSQKPLLPHTTLQRHIRANRNVFIPRFYFPQGKPAPTQQCENTQHRISAAFAQEPGGLVTRERCAVLAQACELPLYWKVPLFLAAAGETATTVDAGRCVEFWKQMVSSCHDAASRFIYILTRGRRAYLIPEDFISLIQDVVDSHPGLTFLKEATEFHSRYVHTVIARIFYCVNRSWSSRISVAELRRSNLLAILQVLEEEEDINQVTAYFSYEHFYVIYCKFWELDRDHDLLIDRQDLTRHNDHALSSRIIERIFGGAVCRTGRRGSAHRDDKMSYTEFVWFLLSEEDKMHPTAIEYWFRCMDLDGDGYISMYELEYFYEEQMHRMESIGIETLPFEDCLCQMLDMVKPAQPGKIALGDLKKCKMTSIFFDTFFNLEKYLDHEQRDPFASQRDHDGDGHELSDWDRYAAEEYELLVAEEGGEQPEPISFDETDCEDALSTNLDMILSPTETFNEVFTAKTGSLPSYGRLSTDDWNGMLSNSKPAPPLSDEDDDYAQDSDECSI